MTLIFKVTVYLLLVQLKEQLTKSLRKCRLSACTYKIITPIKLETIEENVINGTLLYHLSFHIEAIDDHPNASPFISLIESM